MVSQPSIIEGPRWHCKCPQGPVMCARMNSVCPIIKGMRDGKVEALFLSASPGSQEIRTRSVHSRGTVHPLQTVPDDQYFTVETLFIPHRLLCPPFRRATEQRMDSCPVIKQSILVRMFASRVLLLAIAPTFIPSVTQTQCLDKRRQ
jgi:hypothetical protein